MRDISNGVKMQDMIENELLSLVDIDGFSEKYSKDISADKFFGFPLKHIISCEKKLKSSQIPSLAYLSMEYGLGSSIYNVFTPSESLNPVNKISENEVFSNYRLADYLFTLKINEIMDLPIYSGGLGVLAGDTIKTVADMHISSVAVGMLWSMGYFRQRFWFKYGQLPEKMQWDPYSYPGLIPLKNIIKITLNDDEIYLKLWKYYVFSHKKDFVVPLVLLDSNIPQNKESFRQLTGQLYRSDDIYIKILQRVILGMGGIIALKELGCNINIFHLNEGHAAFAFIEKLRAQDYKGVEELKKHFVYTCHTPVKAGHDRFLITDLEKFFNKKDMSLLKEYGVEEKDMVNLTFLAMNLASRKNAVSARHGEVMRVQFADYKDEIKSITNGVHLYTWMSKPVFSLLDKYRNNIGDFHNDVSLLSNVSALKRNDDFRQGIWQAHQENKAKLCGMLDKWELKENVFTLCWARRIAAYKRPILLLMDAERLVNIAKKIGPIQVIFAGKAHPNDNLGFTHVNELMDRVDALSKECDFLKVVMLENYDIYLARILTSSVDVWLNNPLPPFEASGTSGMKAIMNAVLQLSTLDGWVVEAKDAQIGKIFGSQGKLDSINREEDLRLEEDSSLLYDALEEMAKLYYLTNNKDKVDFSSYWIDMMVNCISESARFSTHRMIKEYQKDMWGIG